MCVENPDGDKYKKTDNKLHLKTYRNGFIIDDGPFRSLEDPKNQKFMNEVKKGYIPQELVDQGMKNLGIALDQR
jgi:hypothetical protein